MRFLLVSQGRSGTHMLRAAFLEHPDIPTFVDYRGDLVTIPGALVKCVRDIYGCIPPEAIAGAFTHFGELERCSSTERSGWLEKDWRALRKLHDFTIILTRRNGLRQYLSKRLLELRDFQNWNCAYPRKQTQKPISLDLRGYFAYLAKTQKNIRAISRLLEPFYFIYYEDLVSDWTRTMRGVYEYLNLKWNDPKIVTYLQETRPVNRIISNWQDVVTELGNLPSPNCESKILLNQLQEDV